VVSVKLAVFGLTGVTGARSRSALISSATSAAAVIHVAEAKAGISTGQKANAIV
jgi:hypothetical protein